MSMIYTSCSICKKPILADVYTSRFIGSYICDSCAEEIKKKEKEMTIETITTIAEALDWKIFKDQTGDSYQIDFEKYSPAGEDFMFTISGNSAFELVEEIRDYACSFNEEEHITIWLCAKSQGTTGIPDVKTLVQDAEAIHGMLNELSEALTSSIVKALESANV